MGGERAAAAPQSLVQTREKIGRRPPYTLEPARGASTGLREMRQLRRRLGGLGEELSERIVGLDASGSGWGEGADPQPQLLPPFSSALLPAFPTF